MATATYSLSHVDISNEFPDYPPFTSTSRPSDAQVTGRITTISGEVNGYLERVGTTGTAVAADDEALQWAKRTVVLGVAAWCARSMRGSANARAEHIYQEYRERLAALIDSGGAVLGTGIYSASDSAQGVRTHSSTSPEAGRLRTFHYSRGRSSVF